MKNYTQVRRHKPDDSKFRFRMFHDIPHNPNLGEGQLHVEENQEAVIKSGMWSSAVVVQAKPDQG